MNDRLFWLAVFAVVLFILASNGWVPGEWLIDTSFEYQGRG